MMKTMMIGLMLVVSGCSASDPATRFQANPDQDARVKVIDAFERDPSEATARYRREWEAMGPDKISVVGMAIAGELMTNDPERYEEYERAALEGAQSTDDDEVWAAAAALGRAHGKESINVLFNLTSDPRPTVAGAAVTALGNRVSASRFDDAIADDRRRLLEIVPTLCEGSYRNQIEQYCN
jgi:hypothetical protein